MGVYIVITVATNNEILQVDCKIHAIQNY